VNLQAGLLVGEVRAKSPSHVGDGAVEATLVVTRCRCQVTLGMTLLSHVDDGTAEVTWSWCDVNAESC
jgi:hypothetical protein